MMEQDIGRKESALKVRAFDVMQSFERFEERARAGFTTKEESLTTYGKFIATAANFFQQPGVERQQETRSLVDRLFYQHENTASLPLEFFLKVKERLNKDVLSNGSTPRGEKTWNSELSLIKSETTREAGATWQDFTRERDLRKRLEQMAQEQLDSESETNLLLEITPIEERRQFIQDQAIGLLSKDEDIRSDIARANSYKEALQQGQQKDILIDAERLRDLLSSHREFLQIEDGLLLIDELYARAASGQQEKVRSMLKVLEAQVTNPNFMWQRFVNKGYVSKEVIDGFDEIVTLTELQETASILSDLPKSTKAKHLLPFLEKGISAGLIMEMVEGRYDLPDNLIARHIDALVHFSDVYEKGLRKQPWSLKRKLVTSAVAVAAVGIMVGTPYAMHALDSSENASKSQVEEVIEDQEDDSVHILARDKSIKPQNGTPEGFKKAKKTVIWKIWGGNRSGFYREETASRFDPKTREWLISEEVISAKDSLKESGLPTRQNINLSDSNGRVLDNYVSIPTKNGYAPSSDNLKIEGGTVHPILTQTQDGNYFLNFPSEDVGKTISISYSLDKSENPTIPPPTKNELKRMKEKLITVEDTKYDPFPNGVNEFLVEINERQDLSKAKKAKAVEKFVKDSLRYSLNPFWSDVYHRQATNREFIGKMFGYRFVDCDVANTALVALLRSIDIPSRMTYGFSNNGGFLGDSDNQLTGSERHGWVEAYTDGKWLSLDSTPSKTDSLTASALGISDIDEIFELGAVAGLSFLAMLLATDTLSIGAYGVSRLVNRRNERLAARLSQELEERAKRYFGGLEYTQRIAEFENRNIEKGKVHQKMSRNHALDFILPYAGLQGVWDLERAVKLKKMSTRYEKGELPKEEAENPEIFEFLTKVLGHSEKDTKKRLYRGAYLDARRQFVDGIYDIRDEIVEELHLPQSFVSRCDSLIITKLFSGRLPRDEQGFNQRKIEAINSLYSRYQQERAKIARQKGNILLPPDITIEEFGKSMERLIGFRTVERQMRLAHENAVKSLNQKKLEATPSR